MTNTPEKLTVKVTLNESFYGEFIKMISPKLIEEYNKMDASDRAVISFGMIPHNMALDTETWCIDQIEKHQSKHYETDVKLDKESASIIKCRLGREFALWLFNHHNAVDKHGVVV